MMFVAEVNALMMCVYRKFMVCRGFDVKMLVGVADSLGVNPNANIGVVISGWLPHGQNKIAGIHIVMYTP